LNQLWNWKAGRLVNQLTRLRANANWVFFRPVAKPLREEYRARLTEYLDTAEPDGLAARITRHSAISGILAADQVTQWLFAFDAGAITAFRALALLLAHSESLANVEDLASAGVVIYAPFFHRDTDRLQYADRFTPEIWLEKDPADALPLIPFSFGPAACPGRHVVSLIASAWLAVLLTEATLQLIEPLSLGADEGLPGSLDHFAIRF
jgi:hypothetical protein